MIENQCKLVCCERKNVNVVLDFLSQKQVFAILRSRLLCFCNFGVPLRFSPQKIRPFVELRRITYRDDVERGLFEENAQHLTSSAALVEISNSSNVTAGTSFVELLREKFPRRETRRRQKFGNCFKVQNKRKIWWQSFDLLVKL